MDGGNGYTAMWVYLLYVHLKLLKWEILCYEQFTTIKRKGKKKLNLELGI